MANNPLNRTSFSEVVTVKAVRVPSKKCQHALSLLSDYIYIRPKIRPVQKGTDPATRLVLLKDFGQEMPSSVKDIVAEEGYHLEDFDLQMEYLHFSADEVLKKILPESVGVPNSFELVGHIAHLNLKEEHEPYKSVIGEVILDKNPSVKTVVNKVGTIENEFRVLNMEVLAGEARFETEVKEHAFRFQLDYSKVYWNSRLEHEHDRLVHKFRKGEVICDAMAGVGPFAIPAGKKGCRVLANDLNPESFKYLQRNIKLNGANKNVIPYNLDGRKFIRMVFGHEMELYKSLNIPWGFGTPPVVVDHVVMNLPASAIEFLDVFRGAFCGDEWVGRVLPWVHCYTFIKGHEPDMEVTQLCEKHLGGRIESGLHVHPVRDVAPNKMMICLSFRIPETVGRTRAIGQKSKGTDDNEGSPGVSRELSTSEGSTKRHKA